MLHERTWAEVDLAAVSHNVRAVQDAVGPDVALMPVVKADAYGHGAVPLAWHLLQHDIACLGVGDSTEALELRAAGITAPVLILGAVVPGEMEAVLRGNIEVTVHSGDRVRALRKSRAQQGRARRDPPEGRYGHGPVGLSSGSSSRHRTGSEALATSTTARDRHAPGRYDARRWRSSPTTVAAL